MNKAVILLFMVFAYGVGIVRSQAFATQERIPFTISDNFETGEMCAWEAYPYAQDTGYEPFTTCMRFPSHKGSRFALGKIQRPNDIVEMSEGFIKEIDLWTTASTRMKLALFLVSDRKPETVDITLCLFDGGRYFHTLKSPEPDRWLELDIPAASFGMNGKSLETGSHVQAVTITAHYKVVSHLLSYTILLDDFSLNGERPRRFIARNPSSTTFEHFGFSILNRHFYCNDSFGITVAPEKAPGGASPVSVTCALLDPSGKTVVTGIPLKSSGGEWTASGAYTFKTADPRGQWTAYLTGIDARGNEIKWGFRFLMPGARLTVNDHPRLYFTADELKRNLAAQSPEEKKILENALQKPDYFKNLDLDDIREAENLPTESLTGGPYTMPDLNKWRGPMYRLSRIIESGAWRYAFTGDEAAGLKAKEAMLKLCAFKVWNHPWQESHGNHIYYPVGYVMGPIGIGYDYLHPLLTEGERKFVRDALMEKGIKMFYRDMVEMNRMPSCVTNHISVIVSNLAIDVAAIYGDDSDNPSCEPYLSGILAKMKRYVDRTYYPDGSYGEPLGYQDMATSDLVKAFAVLEKTFGIDYTTTTNVRDTYLYPLYATYADGRTPDFGDDDGFTYKYPLAGNTFMWLSYRMKNPWTYYYVSKSFEAGRVGFPGYFWRPEGMTPKSREELVPSHHFADKGNMVMRSGWSDECSILQFRCGPNANHYHVDQGTFRLTTNGEMLITEAGMEGGYYTNLNYPGYNIQPIGHNTMLVDNDAESQVPGDYENTIAALRNHPRITNSFAGWHADEAEGDITSVYKGKIECYTRSWLYMKPDIIFLYDVVKSDRGHTYSWLFHTDHANGKNPLTATDAGMDIVLPKARLHMDILAPSIESNSIRKSWREESFATFSTADGVKDTKFLAVLVPKAVTDPSAKVVNPVSTLLNLNGWTAAKVENGDTVIRAFFRAEGSRGITAAGEFLTDAGRFAVSAARNGMIDRVFVRDATSFSKEGTLVFGCTTPMTASLFSHDGGMDVEMDATAPCDIRIGLERRPSTVTVDGAPLSGWQYDQSGKSLSFSGKPGHCLVMIR